MIEVGIIPRSYDLLSQTMWLDDHPETINDAPYASCRPETRHLSFLDRNAVLSPALNVYPAHEVNQDPAKASGSLTRGAGHIREVLHSRKVVNVTYQF